MRGSSILRFGSIVAGMAFAVPAMIAQNSIPLYGPVNVRTSQAGTGFGANTNAFNNSTLNLNCSATPITAVISSTADGTGNVLVDNNIGLTVASGSNAGTQVNVCVGGTVDSTPNGPSQNCFNKTYQGPASGGKLNGLDPDTLVAAGGVAPIDVSGLLQPGSVQVAVNLNDTGGELGSSTLYLDTNCTLAGVTGPAGITGNPIPQTNPAPAQLTQSFPFNATANQKVQFVYDLSQAQAVGSLTITPNTIPGAGDIPIDPATFQSTYVPNTSFATSNCMIHTGEALNGAPACKLYTIECQVGAGANQSGAQCPVSSLPNELFQAVFDGPGFTLPDIATPNGPTFHQGVGFLMASETWTGGPCAFDPASGLQDLTCPQNLLSSFSGPGLYIASGHTSHPNSAFIPVAQVPEDLTTVTVAGQQPGGWIDTSNASVTLSSQPPVLTGTNLPGAASFVASPIQSITYGISPANNVPVPGTPVSTDTVVENTTPCPSPSNPLDPPATVFATPAQSLSGLADGNYLLHYFAQDCAGTEELQFNQGAGGSWSTSYYTFPVNVDTIAPVVASGPVLSPLPGNSGSYMVGQAVTATYICTDERSGLVRCGASTFSPNSGVLNSGPLNGPVDTSTPGVKTYTVTAIDAAGNQSSASVNYLVTGYDAAIGMVLIPPSVPYSLGTNAFVTVASSGGHIPTGSVRLYDGATLLQTSTLHGRGGAYFDVDGLAAGVHPLSAVYSGDAFNPGGASAPANFTVTPASVFVQLVPSSRNVSGGNLTLNAAVLSWSARPPNAVGTVVFYDGGNALTTVPVTSEGRAALTLPVSSLSKGSHTFTASYSGSANYSAGKGTAVVTVK